MFQRITSTLKEKLTLLLINLRVKIINFIEYVYVVINYYSHPIFFKIDITLLLSYLWRNPFKISKQFLLLKGESNIYMYGETPLTTMERIAHECQLSVQDRVFELGCGRGRTCFWLNQFIGCAVVGIDFVPVFIEKALKFKRRFKIQRVFFRCEDLFQADLTGATVIYLYGTCFSAASIDLLIEQLSHLPEGTKIITVSYALTEYQPEAPFHILKQFSASFTWGTTDVYLQIKQEHMEEVISHVNEY